MNLEDLKKLIYDKNQMASSRDRRQSLTQKMADLNDQGKNCLSCTGMCCTYLFNSMQATPLETLELCISLAKENRLNNELLEKMKTYVKEFRLDVVISLGKGKSFRRTYTCPFFKEGEKGCSISLHDKPYGCLGFNPMEKDVFTEGKCKVYLDSHEKREVEFLEQENKINQILVNELGLYWKKLPIPLAIIELTKKIRL